jgi:hypothetical protein
MSAINQNQTRKHQPELDMTFGSSAIPRSTTTGTSGAVLSSEELG